VIHELDWSVGEILNALDDLGLAENTLVIFTSDNGASVVAVDRSRLWGWGHPPNGILRGHKGRITEGGHRIPFMARWPGKIKPGSRSDELISLTDLMATFAAILGKELPPSAGPDSYTALPELLGKPSLDPDRPVVFAAGTGALCLRLGKWKYFEGQTIDGVNPFLEKKPPLDPALPPGQLYNLDTDIREANNLYSQYPERVESMKRKLEAIRNAKR
jgi:arylsulfatase A